MRKFQRYLTAGNLLYIGSILFALGVLFKTFYERLRLPEGVCPIESNRPLLYAALIILIGVNLGIYLYGSWKKKRKFK